MPRPRKAAPAYQLHKATGQAVVRLRNPDGSRPLVYLGPHGTPESWDEYHRVVAEWQASGHAQMVRRRQPDVTVAEVLLAYLKHADGYYRKGGEPTSHLDRIKRALKPARELYGHTRAADFDTLALKAVRERYLTHPCTRCSGDGYRMVKPKRKDAQPERRACAYCDGTGTKTAIYRHANHLAGCLVRAFKWAAAEKLVAGEVYRDLLTLEGLRRGRGQGRSPGKVRPVALDLVEATLPFLLPPVAAMVRLQLHTGMRPGEVCSLRPQDLDRSGEVWVYRPAGHKTEHHGHERVVAVGPQAQAVLLPFLEGRSPDAYCFSPAEAMAARYAALRAARKTKVQPSQQSRAKAARKKPLRDHYRVDSYHKAVRQACRLNGLDDWHPHQLRHTRATEVRKKYGLDAAQVVLGHAQANVTEVYAELDLALAAKVARETG